MIVTIVTKFCQGESLATQDPKGPKCSIHHCHSSCSTRGSEKQLTTSVRSSHRHLYFVAPKLEDDHVPNDIEGCDE